MLHATPASQINYESYFSKISALRQPSPIRALQPLVKLPGMISLGGGMPNSSLFPFKGMSMNVNGEEVAFTQSELGEALQYSPTPGLPKFVELLREIQVREHKPHMDAKNWSLCVTNGSQDALAKAFEMLLNEGDSMLVESPCYSGAIAAVTPLGVKLLEMETDQHGIVPDKLEALLERVSSDKSLRKPRVLYTVPTGQNPSGATLSDERRQKVYAIAQKHELIILEDDPYYNLYYGEKPAAEYKGEFQRPALRSLFSMDTDGRVLRFDSFSKVLSSGLRIGYATGPTPLINRMELHTQSCSLHASGMSQLMIQKLLQKWGKDEWNNHVNKVAKHYLERRDIFLAAADKHLKGLATWHAPSAGMFVWFRLVSGKDSKALIEEKALSQKVILLPGQAFSPLGKKSDYVRAAFSTATPEEMDIALSRFANILKEQ